MGRALIAAAVVVAGAGCIDFEADRAECVKQGRCSGAQLDAAIIIRIPSSYTASHNFLFMNDLHKILDLTRWAPSGDNSQPWRFRIVADDLVEVLIRLDKPSVFDHGHFATGVSAGALFATLRAAASSYGYDVAITVGEATEAELLYHVTVTKNSATRNPELAEVIQKRSVCRVPYLKRPLRQDENRYCRTLPERVSN